MSKFSKNLVSGENQVHWVEIISQQNWEKKNFKKPAELQICQLCKFGKILLHFGQKFAKIWHNWPKFAKILPGFAEFSFFLQILQ